MYDMIIIGAGIAGLTSALYAKRAGLSVLLIEKAFYGGQIMNTPEIQNFPGTPSVSGFDLMQTVYQQAVTEFETPLVTEAITKVELNSPIKKIHTTKQAYESKTVIIATGAKHRLLECPGEERLAGKGVSYCATCDGAFFKNKTVAVVGGGNTALQDAAYLANICETVYLIHRRNEFRATPIEVEQALRSERVVPLYSSIVTEIHGDQSVNAITVSQLETQTQQLLPVDGVFIAVGNVPDSTLFRGMVELDAQGYIIAGEDCKTNLDGVFVAGDIRQKQVRQLVTAAADGAVSAEMAALYLQS